MYQSINRFDNVESLPLVLLKDSSMDELEQERTILEI